MSGKLQVCRPRDPKKGQVARDVTPPFLGRNRIWRDSYPPCSVVLFCVGGASRSHRVNDLAHAAFTGRHF